MYKYGLYYEEVTELRRKIIDYRSQRDEDEKVVGLSFSDKELRIIQVGLGELQKENHYFPNPITIISNNSVEEKPINNTTKLIATKSNWIVESGKMYFGLFFWIGLSKAVIDVIDFIINWIKSHG